MHTTKVIGFAGSMGSGKTTMARALLFYIDGARRVSFAAPLKQALETLGFPEPPAEMKNRPYPGETYSWRTLAQRLGTEWGRAIDPDIWVKVLEKQVDLLPCPVVVCDDVRFENEAAMIRKRGVLIHLRRPGYITADTFSHASEKGVKMQPDSDIILRVPEGAEAINSAAKMLYDSLVIRKVVTV